MLPHSYCPTIQVPRLVAFENVDLTGSWASISRRFARTQPAKSDFPNSLAPLHLASLHSFPVDAFDLTPSVLAQLQDFSPDRAGISVRVKGEVLRQKALTKNHAVFDDIEVVFSPAFPVNVGSDTRQMANMPGDAFSFVFCYNNMGILGVDGVQDLQKDVHAFFCHGGFVYFDTFRNVVGVNMIQDPKIQSNFMIHFGP